MEPIEIQSQADLDQQWAEAQRWTKETHPHDLINFFTKLNQSKPQKLTFAEWNILSNMGILVIQEALHRNTFIKD